GVAEGAEVLARIETESRSVRKRAHHAAGVGGPLGLCRVLEDPIAPRVPPRGRIRSMAQACPYRWTATIAAVRGVTTAAAAAGSSKPVSPQHLRRWRS